MPAACPLIHTGTGWLNGEEEVDGLMAEIQACTGTGVGRDEQKGLRGWVSCVHNSGYDATKQPSKSDTIRYLSDDSLGSTLLVGPRTGRTERKGMYCTCEQCKYIRGVWTGFSHTEETEIHRRATCGTIKYWDMHALRALGVKRHKPFLYSLGARWTRVPEVRHGGASFPSQ